MGSLAASADAARQRCAASREELAQLRQSLEARLKHCFFLLRKDRSDLGLHMLNLNGLPIGFGVGLRQ